MIAAGYDMEERENFYNQCANETRDDYEDQVKRLEISEAIHDIDSKLTDLERALNITSNRV